MGMPMSMMMEVSYEPESTGTKFSDYPAEQLEAGAAAFRSMFRCALGEILCCPMLEAKSAFFAAGSSGDCASPRQG